ncbi:MAG: ATP-binding protein [Fibrobacter sp.]|nr:ATP-binding protein [Fibrobacter sp.]
MMNEFEPAQLLRDLGDMLLKIEIDSDMWVGRTAKEKLNYLKRKVCGENSAKYLNVGSRLLESILGIVRANTNSSVVRGYVNVVDTALNLAKASVVVNNTFIAQRYETHTDFDDLAKFMGYRDGNHICVRQLDATPEICKSVVSMTKAAQAKYHFTITKVEAPADAKSKDAHPNVTYMLAKLNGAVIGLELTYVQSKNPAANTNNQNAGEFAYINVATSMGDYHNADVPEDTLGSDILTMVESIVYSNYIDSVDVSKNIIRIDGSSIHTEPRVDVNFEIKNIDLEDMAKTCRTILNAKKRRGYILQGDPGTGKTVSIHKLIMQFTDVPVFWISPDAISDTIKMRNVFRLLNMFPGSIFVFDDIDGNNLGEKSNLTSTFITCIDATNSAKFSGILILTINEPQRLHSTIRTRAERIDEVIHVLNPNSVDQIADIVHQRYIHLGKTAPDWVDVDNDEFKAAAEKIISANFTHAHVASLISDLADLYSDGYECADFARLIDKRISSINNAKMVADSDGHITTAPAEKTNRARVLYKV